MGPDYAHAEARKSPALDGKVERDSEGKEVRYPVMLSAMEKLVARKVCMAFKVRRKRRPARLLPLRRDVDFVSSLQQTVCGFDLLRANGHSYVCDVNGFSFVKNSMKYYDDCAKILGYHLRFFCLGGVIPHPSFLPEIPRFGSSRVSSLAPQEHRDARARSSVSDSLVHPDGGRGHPHCPHYVRDHVSHHRLQVLGAVPGGVV